MVSLKALNITVSTSIPESSHSIKDQLNPIRRCYVDIQFSKPLDNLFSHLTFQNYFCSCITIHQMRTTPYGEESEIILPKRKLMKYAHYQDDAENWHVVKAEEFNDNFAPTKLETLRIFMYQPSPIWHKIELRQIAAFSNSLSSPSPCTSTPVKCELERAPSPKSCRTSRMTQGLREASPYILQMNSVLQDLKHLTRQCGNH